MARDTEAVTLAPSGRPRAAGRARFQSPVRRILTLTGLARPQLAARLTFFGLILVVAAASAVVFVNALGWLDRPFAGFLVNPRMVVATVGQYHWTGPDAGVQNPDRIVSANGRPITSMRALDAIVAATPAGHPVDYLIARRGAEVEVSVPTMRFDWTDWATIFGITFFSGLAFVLIGVVAFVLKPDAEASFALLVACFLLGIYSIISFDVFATHWGFVRLYLLADALLPAAFVHLALVFPEKRRLARDHPWVLLAPYALALAIAVPYEVFYGRGPYVLLQRATRLYAVAGALLLLASTLHAWLRNASPLARQRAKVLLVGAALAFPIPALARYSAVVGGAFLGVTLQTNVLAVPILIFPASIAYAIARHNLFDVDVYIKRAVGYGIMTALVGVTYLSTQTVMNQLILAAFGEGGGRISPIIFALSVVLFFNPVNRKVQGTVDRVFFRRKLDYKEAISAVSNALASMLNLDQIVQHVIGTVRKEMFVDRAALIVLASERRECRTFVVGDRVNEVAAAVPQAAIGYDDPLLALIREERALLTRYDLEEDPRYVEAREGCLASFAAVGASLAVPLVYRDEVKGVLALGEKKSGEFYAREDVDLLTTMASQAAVAIQNAHAHEEVVRYAEELAASLRRIQILESIKTNLAKFVPKTVQDLIEESPEAPVFDKREADVSVLFADITGYTRLSAQMELEQVNRLVERYFSAFLDEIMKHGGDVNETAGDGLMVIFRDPDPGKHARSAVLAALGIHRQSQRINRELHGQFEPITMHVGVNSGVASVGATKIEGAAGTRWTYTASGPTTNLAARLAALAEGGALVMSEETRRRLGDEFPAEDLGPQSLKNVAHPVRAYRLTAAADAAVAAPPSVERRRHQRTPVSWLVRLWAGAEPVVGHAVDAGAHGLCVGNLPIAALTVGQSYRLEVLTGADGEFPCTGKVLYFSDRGVSFRIDEPLPVE